MRGLRIIVGLRAPRELSAAEAETLKELAALLMNQMELRLAARKVGELEQLERRMSKQLRQANEARLGNAGSLLH
jgi:GAF domain-containing protein